MRFRQTLELVKVNMIYANPQMIEQKRNKQAKYGNSGSSAYASLFWQNGLLLVMFLLLFGFVFSNMDLANYPGMFTTFVATFVLMAMLQGFYMIYNLFYESKDLIHYRPLPFKESEVFSAKLVVLAFMLLPYLIPLWVLFVFLGISAGNSLIPMLLGTFLLFLLVLAVVFAFSIVLVHFITKLPMFHKNKQLITTILYALSSFGMIAVFIGLSLFEPSEADLAQGIIPDAPVIPFFEPFHHIFIEPTSLEAWLKLLGWVVVLAVLAVVIAKWVIPTFYQEDVAETPAKKTTEPVKVKKSKRSGSVNQTLIRYNFGLIQDGTLIMQFLSSKLLIPLVVVGPMLFDGIDLSDMPLLYWSVFFFAGFIFTFLTLNGISIVGVIISLDRENFLYMKSLPFSMTAYLQIKFGFAFLLEWIFPTMVAVVFFIVAQVPLLLGLSFLAGLTIGTFALSQYFFVRDYRMLDLEWQNLTELFNRGSGTWLQFLWIFGSIFLGTVLVVLVAMLLTFLPPLWQTVLSLVVVIGPTLLSAVALLKYKNTFWAQFAD